jgi:fatty acyl-CoA reductase
MSVNMSRPELDLDEPAQKQNGNPGSSQIVPFFANKSVFLTGATGFMGKAIIEKLLRTCPSIGTIYILIRPKPGYTLQGRLDKLLDSRLYSRLKQENPAALSKLIPIDGDISLPSLGMSSGDRARVTEDVSVVIHSAATVRFDEPLKLALNLNVGGTVRVVELCKEMTGLVSLVHVSTAYANCERGEIEEVLYSPPSDPHKILQCLDLMDEDLVSRITPALIRPKPNTYTYTKALAESILLSEAERLPISIVRPSIVTATWVEPVQGWIDNLNGPTGLFAAFGKGILRTILVHGAKVADLVPLDYPVNLILAAAWERAGRPNKVRKMSDSGNVKI